MIDRKKYIFGDYVESVGFRTESVKNRERPSFKKIDKKEELLLLAENSSILVMRMM